MVVHVVHINPYIELPGKHGLKIMVLCDQCPATMLRTKRGLGRLLGSAKQRFNCNKQWWIILVVLHSVFHFHMVIEGRVLLILVCKRSQIT